MRNKILLSLILFLPFAYVWSCGNQDKMPVATQIRFPADLADFSLFKGRISDLVPAEGVHLLELSSTLFTDYAEKQRLIKLPPGKQLTGTGNGLPQFPEGTILAKTFYELKDKSNPAAGRQIIETRILWLKNGIWNAGTYQWNATQTKAGYITHSASVNVSWKERKGIRKINYHIPGQQECVSCHHYNNLVIPIGPKMMNLNRTVVREGKLVNQIKDLQQKKLLHLTLNYLSLTTMPAYQNNKLDIGHRARAYLDINCAHCHNPGGLAYRQSLLLSYDVPLSKTGIYFNKNNIIARTATLGDMHMPKLGTTILDTAGVQLIRDYINSLGSEPPVQ